MKRIIVMAIGISLLGAGVQSCKKGENDPFLSLSSRKARVAGEWTVSSYESTETSTGTDNFGNYTSIYSETFNGSIVTSKSSTTYATTPQANNSDETSYNQVLDYTFEKDGTFKVKATMSANGETAVVEQEGTWVFLDKNKSLDLGKKEAIVLTFTKETETYDGESDVYTYTGLTGDQVLMIDQLKSKEMILKTESSYAYSGNSGNSKGSWTLTAK